MVVSSRVCSRCKGDIISVVKTFAFLGIDCDGRRLCFTKKQSARCEMVVTAAKFLRFKGMNASGWRLIFSVLVYKSFLRPMVMMEYGCQLMRCSDSVFTCDGKGSECGLEHDVILRWHGR